MYAYMHFFAEGVFDYGVRFGVCQSRDVMTLKYRLSLSFVYRPLFGCVRSIRRESGIFCLEYDAELILFCFYLKRSLACVFCFRDWCVQL